MFLGVPGMYQRRFIHTVKMYKVISRTVLTNNNKFHCNRKRMLIRFVLSAHCTVSNKTSQMSGKISRSVNLDFQGCLSRKKIWRDPTESHLPVKLSIYFYKHVQILIKIHGH